MYAYFFVRHITQVVEPQTVSVAIELRSANYSSYLLMFERIRDISTCCVGVA